MGRGKIEIKRIQNAVHRQVTFCKRRGGLMKKAYELSVLCDAEVAVVVFSSRGKLYEFATNSMKTILERYQQCSPNLKILGLSECTSKSLEQEIQMLKKQIDHLENVIRYLMGGGLSSMTLEELNQLEGLLTIGINQIQTKKDQLMLEEIEILQKKEHLWKISNMFLQGKLAECRNIEKTTSILTSEFENTIPMQHVTLGLN